MNEGTIFHWMDIAIVSFWCRRGGKNCEPFTRDLPQDAVGIETARLFLPRSLCGDAGEQMTLPTAAKQREISYEELCDTIRQKLTVINGRAAMIEMSSKDAPLKMDAANICRAALGIEEFLREVKVVSKP